MSQNKAYLLIDHLDNNLSAGDALAVETSIKNDENMAKEWQYLHVAVEAIQEAGLYDRVTAIKNQYLSQQSGQAKTGIVHSIYRNTLRAAACALILLGAVAVYKYTTVNATGVYTKYYSSYELSTSRGSENSNEMEQAYRSKNWQQVISLFQASNKTNNKSYFLLGMASLELKHYNEAIEAFSKIIDSNTQSGDDYFQDEAEYYLAMAYLANQEPAKAIPILEKIKSDKNNIYYNKVSEISSVDLMILREKNGK